MTTDPLSKEIESTQGAIYSTDRLPFSLSKVCVEQVFLPSPEVARYVIHNLPKYFVDEVCLAALGRVASEAHNHIELAKLIIRRDKLQWVTSDPEFPKQSPYFIESCEDQLVATREEIDDLKFKFGLQTESS